TDAQVAEMKRTIREIRRAVEQGGDGIDEDFSFHLAVAQGTQNRFFVVALEGLRSQINLGIQLIRNLSTEPAALHLDIIESEHAEILNAIENQDAEQAVMTMVSHLSKGINRVFSTVS
ncbi:MAG: FadR family transcriptional regulator, partial [Hyphomicrobiales bacterium]|nr:FadR family transcriptional regulator [Hyphomicrobiales bacterium]